MRYFNKQLSKYILYYSQALRFKEIDDLIASEIITSREMACRLVEFCEKMYDQGNIDVEAGMLIENKSIFIYEIEKAYLTIHDLVRDNGFGDLVDDISICFEVQNCMRNQVKPKI